jgi:hypothetical protein
MSLDRPLSCEQISNLRQRPARRQSMTNSPRFSSRRAMTLVEVITSMCLIALTSTSLIATSILARRLTEIAVYQSSVAAIMQGYLEQIKNMPFETLPLSPAAGTSMSGSYATLYSVATLKDDITADPLVLSPLAPLTPANITLGSVPVAVYDNTKVFDVNRAADLTVHIWLWIQDLTPSGYGATQQAKAITLLYMWQIQDGNTTRSYTGMIKNLRSLVPTH